MSGEPTAPEHPRLLGDFRPLPGLIKSDYTDFQVEEVPLYPFAGTGTHTCFLVEKAGLSTPQAVQDIARVLNVRRVDIGYAGLKDARAVTRQWMSVEHVAPETVAAISLSRLRILDVTRHGNKLRLGHLKGNRFTIRVRQSQPERLAEAQDGLARLVREGVPNYFGPQRFGVRGDTWLAGRALLKREADEAIDVLLGRAAATDRGDLLRARQHYDRGNYAVAARLWPRLFRDERKALKVLAKTGGDKRRAVAAIDRTARRFYISAYQSHLFNRVVAARLPEGLGRLWLEDLAWLHASGAVFRVLDPAVEQPRADAFEISPTGPLFGYRMTQPGARAAEIEGGILAEEELPPEVFARGPMRVQGARRALRFQPRDAQIALGADERGQYLELRFLLPRGCYATALLRELFAPGPTESEEREDESVEEADD